MTANQFLSKASLKLWLGWVIANTIGGAIGSWLGELFFNQEPGFFLEGLGISVPIYLCQGIFLTSKIPKTLGWIVVSSFVSTLCIGSSPYLIILSCFITLGRSESLCFGVYGLFTGCITGFMQWFFFLQKFPTSIRWIVFSSIGSAVGLCVGNAVMTSQGGEVLVSPGSSIHGLIWMGAISRFFNGAITGIALIQLLQPKHQQELE